MKDSLSAAIGAGAGLIGSLAKKRPPRYDPMQSAYQGLDARTGRTPAATGKGPNRSTPETALDDFGASRDFYRDRLAGKDMFSAEDYDLLLAPFVAGAAADAADARRRAVERSTSLGIGPRSGMFEEVMANIDRTATGRRRGAQADLQRAALERRAQMAQASAAALLDLVMMDQSFRTGEHDKWFQAKAARAANPGGWRGALAGMAQGALIGLGASGSAPAAGVSNDSTMPWHYTGPSFERPEGVPYRPDPRMGSFAPGPTRNPYSFSVEDMDALMSNLNLGGGYTRPAALRVR